MINRTLRMLAVPLVLLAGACSDREPNQLSDPSSVQNREGWRYERGITFVARDSGEPVAVPLEFASSPRADGHDREARAWLARGETWDPFVDERWTGSAAAGVWRVIPPSDLRIGVGQSGDLEWLRFQSGERRLRIQIGTTAGRWHGGERERFRIMRGDLSLGPETMPGFVVEEMRVARDGSRGGGELTSDRLVLLDSEGVAVYLLHETRPTREEQAEPAANWVLVAGQDQAAHDGTVEWMQVRTLEEGRREIPLHWSFSAPESGVSGEVTALGYDTTLGAERGGRREVEVRYTVEGWVERRGERVSVVGVVRHQQK